MRYTSQGRLITSPKMHTCVCCYPLWCLITTMRLVFALLGLHLLPTNGRMAHVPCQRNKLGLLEAFTPLSRTYRLVEVIE